MKTPLEMALERIEIRQKHEEALRDEAVAAKQWSHVPGRDGIAIGLMLAAKIVSEEIAAQAR